ncbi:hypothetical protein [Actinoplanes sp. L3-i22]|uniref:glycoside hydrolase family 113 n=1 Tax=Actinoplanes sp. L3-i22 TaxID=2836373 RepID=UPI001C75362A|nr:hypothetical protein [Actinoplanes sp. L3-i22]BCY15623.1 hypothetical protein L3i22_107110 [Actinoplanes sp. L3-i22]
MNRPERPLRLRSVLAALIVTQLAACGPLAPHIPDSPVRKPAAAEATPTATTAPPVTTAVRATEAQLGVQIYWHGVVGSKPVRANAIRLLDYVAGLGANSVGITFPIYTDGARPSRVYTRAGDTPTPNDLRIITELAKERGLRVLIRPLIDEVNLAPGGAWRGSIKPPSVDGWFTSYTQALMPFLIAAQSARADLFVIGSELDSLVVHQEQWRTTVTTMGKIFKGRLVYADNWGTWETGRPGVPGAEPGLDAYPQLGLPDSASLQQVTAAWSAWLRKRPAELDKTVFQEVGIAASPGAYEKPTTWPRNRQKLTPQIQIRWFAGACAAAKSLHMAGIYFWTLDAWADPADAAGYDVGSFIGRGDQAIRECFASGWPGQ